MKLAKFLDKLAWNLSLGVGLRAAIRKAAWHVGWWPHGEAVVPFYDLMAWEFDDGDGNTIELHQLVAPDGDLIQLELPRRWGS